MPKIKITEIDNTRLIQYDDTNNAVYIPSKLSGTASASLERPLLYTKASALENDATAKNYDTGSANYAVARQLISLGLPVYFDGFVQSDLTQDEGTDKLLARFAELKDKTRYNVRFLTLGDLADGDTAGTYATAMWATAASRGDCVALIDVPSSVEDGADAVQAIRTYVTTTVKAPAGDSTVANASSPDSFGGAYVPWITVDFGGTYADVHVPGSVGELLAFAHSIQNNPIWYSASGSFRGVIPELTGVDIDFSNADCEVLQARSADEEVGLGEDGDNVGVAINPITTVEPYGYIVWGNRTLKNNQDDGNLQATAFMNVRLLVTEIAKTVFNAARKYTFEQNNNVLWANFKSEITPLLDRMQSGNGINGYKIAKISTDKRGLLKARITIAPIEAVEDFDIEIAMENSTAEIAQ